MEDDLRILLRGCNSQREAEQIADAYAREAKGKATVLDNILLERKRKETGAKKPVRLPKPPPPTVTEKEVKVSQLSTFDIFTSGVYQRPVITRYPLTKTDVTKFDSVHDDSIRVVSILQTAHLARPDIAIAGVQSKQPQTKESSSNAVVPLNDGPGVEKKALQTAVDLPIAEDRLPPKKRRKKKIAVQEEAPQPAVAGFSQSFKLSATIEPPQGSSRGEANLGAVAPSPRMRRTKLKCITDGFPDYSDSDSENFDNKEERASATLEEVGGSAHVNLIPASTYNTESYHVPPLATYTSDSANFTRIHDRDNFEAANQNISKNFIDYGKEERQLRQKALEAAIRWPLSHSAGLLAISTLSPNAEASDNSDSDSESETDLSSESESSESASDFYVQSAKTKIVDEQARVKLVENAAQYDSQTLELTPPTSTMPEEEYVFHHPSDLASSVARHLIDYVKIEASSVSRHFIDYGKSEKSDSDEERKPGQRLERELMLDFAKPATNAFISQGDHPVPLGTPGEQQEHTRSKVLSSNVDVRENIDTSSGARRSVTSVDKGALTSFEVEDRVSPLVVNANELVYVAVTKSARKYETQNSTIVTSNDLAVRNTATTATVQSTQKSNFIAQPEKEKHSKRRRSSSKHKSKRKNQYERSKIELFSPVEEVSTPVTTTERSTAFLREKSAPLEGKHKTPNNADVTEINQVANNSRDGNILTNDNESKNAISMKNIKVKKPARVNEENKTIFETMNSTADKLSKNSEMALKNRSMQLVPKVSVLQERLGNLKTSIPTAVSDQPRATVERPITGNQSSGQLSPFPVLPDIKAAAKSKSTNTKGVEHAEMCDYSAPAPTTTATYPIAAYAYPYAKNHKRAKGRDLDAYVSALEQLVDSSLQYLIASTGERLGKEQPLTVAKAKHEVKKSERGSKKLKPAIVRKLLYGKYSQQIDSFLEIPK